MKSFLVHSPPHFTSLRGHVICSHQPTYLLITPGVFSALFSSWLKSTGLSLSQQYKEERRQPVSIRSCRRWNEERKPSTLPGREHYHSFNITRLICILQTFSFLSLSLQDVVPWTCVSHHPPRGTAGHTDLRQQNNSMAKTPEH